MLNKEVCRYQRDVAARLYRHAQEQEAWLRKNKRKERDVSERGDGVCWRNVKLDSQPFKVCVKPLCSMLSIQPVTLLASHSTQSID